MFVFLLFFCFIFCNTLTMEIIDQNNNSIYFWDHDNSCIKKFGENSKDTQKLSCREKFKIGLYNLFLHDFSNYNLLVTTPSKVTVSCLPAYPSSDNLVNCIDKISDGYSFFVSTLKKSLKKCNDLEKVLFFWERKKFRKALLTFVHNSLTNNTLNSMMNIQDIQTQSMNTNENFRNVILMLSLLFTLQRAFFEKKFFQAFVGICFTVFTIVYFGTRLNALKEIDLKN